jgi:subtilase family serine protease
VKKPSWQSGLGVPNDGVRDVPDVALTASAHDSYTFVTGGSPYPVSGTSAATPAFAGMVALLINTWSRQAHKSSPGSAT